MKDIFVVISVFAIVGHYIMKAHELRPQRKTANSTTSWVSQVTAYTSEPRQTDSTPCISADNKNICRRHARWMRGYGHGKPFPFKYCAAADRDIPLGTVLEIGSHGKCVVVDRTNKRADGTGQVDLYFGKGARATKTAYSWGRRKKRISIVRWGPQT